VSKPEYIPTIWQAVKSLLGYQIIFYLINYLSITLLIKVKGYRADDLDVQILVTGLGFIFFLGWLSRKNRLALVSYLYPARFELKYLFPLILLIPGTDIIASELGNRISTVFPLDGQVGYSLMELFSPDGGWEKSLVLVVFLAPVVEETIFRGLFLRGFEKYYSNSRAVLASSLLFGLFHMNIWQFPGAFIWGLLAGWLFIRTRSLLFCILGHALLNGLGFIAIVLKTRYHFVIPGYSSPYGEGVYQPLGFTVIGLILVATGILIFAQKFQGNGDCL
jgi:membrane protease YdiL (CAAX protease family)